jgi:hypothetical protein
MFKNLSLKIKEGLHTFFTNDYVVLFICWVIGFLPALIGVVLWFILEPVGFWQKTAMFVLYFSVLLPFQIITLIFAIYIQTNFNRK